jgi:S1-C subfamily serine protease
MQTGSRATEGDPMAYIRSVGMNPAFGMRPLPEATFKAPETTIKFEGVSRKKSALKTAALMAAILGTSGGVGSSVRAVDTDTFSLRPHTVSTPASDLQRELDALREVIIPLDVIERTAPIAVKIIGKEGIGSGFFIRDHKGDYYLITNDHVTRGNDNKGRFTVRLYNGSSDLRTMVLLNAEVVKKPGATTPRPSEVLPDQPEEQFLTSMKYDLSVLRIIPENGRPFVPPAFLTSEEMRDINRERLRVGEHVFSIGAPRNYEDTINLGHLSHADRRNPAAFDANGVQVDSPVNPGNSGGPLLDRNGRLIGVINSKVDTSDGLGFAIRVDTLVQWLSSVGIDMTRH